MACISPRSGKARTAYSSKAEAREGARHVRQRYGQDMVPYACDQCGAWHLSPRERQTPSTPCPVCRGADGQPKASYETREAAESRAKILFKEQRKRLSVYPCEAGYGWHLTKQR